MGEKVHDKELVTFKEMMFSDSIQVDALAQLLVEKGVITENEFHAKLRDVMIEYESKGKEKLG